MTKKKVTLRLDGDRMAELRHLARARSLSAAVDDAVSAYLPQLRHLDAVDEWLAEMDREFGPVPQETLEVAAQIVDAWMVDRR